MIKNTTWEITKLSALYPKFILGLFGLWDLLRLREMLTILVNPGLNYFVLSVYIKFRDYVCLTSILLVRSIKGRYFF